MSAPASKRPRISRLFLTTALAAAALVGCGVWPFNQIFHGILEGGSTVTNTSLGITYTIPKGFYQDKYEATTIKLAILNQHENGAHQPGKRPWIYIQRVDEERENSTEQPLDDAKNLALSWVGYTENAASNIRQRSWVGPNLPGGEYAYDSVNADGKPESCAVAVVGYPGHRIQINSMGGNGRPVYLSEVRDVALSAKPIGPPQT